MTALKTGLEHVSMVESVRHSRHTGYEGSKVHPCMKNQAEGPAQPKVPLPEAVGHRGWRAAAVSIASFHARSG